MDILGISCFYHDAAAAIVRDGVLLAASEEERFSRIKHDAGFPLNAVRFCLEMAGIQGQDLDYVVFYEKPFLKFERILSTALHTFPRSSTMFREAMTHWSTEKLWIKTKIQEELKVPAQKILFSEHHVSHAASAFFCSPFERAAILTADGVGEWATTMMATGTARWQADGTNAIQSLRELKFPHSLGLLYSVFTAFLGFEVNEGEYKVMGMAPYGVPRYVDEVWKLLRQTDNGGFRLAMDYFSYHRCADRGFTRKFEALFGPPRNPREEFVVEENPVPGKLTGHSPSRDQHYADVAASIQHVIEELLLRLVRQLHTETGLTRLCLAGGVAYNSVANGRILRETPFEEVYIQPAAGDSGGAIGAALYAYHVLLQQPRAFVMEHAYWGQRYSVGSIEEALARHHLEAECFPGEQDLVRATGHRLVQGQVVGWYQDRCEWGPRALGHRSILADPRRAEMKAIVNRKIKFREPFRPFAPSVLDRRADEFMDYPEGKGRSPAKFMLAVSPVREACREKIPAVTHVDGTGRFQVVDRASNSLYYDLIEMFESETGIPVVLNTSFNLRGEPIVNTPEQAIATFLRSEMDALVLGPYLVSKRAAR